MFVARRGNSMTEPRRGGMFVAGCRFSFSTSIIPEGLPIGSNEGPAHFSPPRDDVPLECKSFMGRPEGGRKKSAENRCADVLIFKPT
jgi:hypothetical protein